MRTIKVIRRNAAFIVLLCVVLAFSSCSSIACIPERNNTSRNFLIHDDWSDEVKNALNDLLDYYGADDVSDESRGKQYAVFDFDNTCSIFDVEEQLAIYQLCTMAFEIEPEDMRSVLLTDLETPEKDLSEFGYGKGSLEDWAGDISDAYSILWEKYRSYRLFQPSPFVINVTHSMCEP